jgi:hypothetical protein
MDAATTTGIFTLAGALSGTALASTVAAVGKHFADRRADRGEAGHLLARVTQAATALEPELAMYRERRDSRRANFRAAGQALLQVLAAHREGNAL